MLANESSTAGIGLFTFPTLSLAGVGMLALLDVGLRGHAEDDTEPP